MILIQRMILCLDQDKVLVLLPTFLHILIESCTSEDVLNVSQLLNQICVKYKQDGAVYLDVAIFPFIQKCQSLVASLLENFRTAKGNDPLSSTNIPPHIEVEQLSIQKMVYALLQHIVSNDATVILLSPSNLPHLENFLQLMLEGIRKTQDTAIKKACIIFFKDLIMQWAGQDVLGSNGKNVNVGDPKQFSIVQNGLIHFVFQNLLPGLIYCILDPMFKERDAMQARNVREIGLLLHVIKSERGANEFEHHFINQLLTRFNCPANVMASFKSANDEKDMYKCLQDFMAALKGR